MFCMPNDLGRPIDSWKSAVLLLEVARPHLFEGESFDSEVRAQEEVVRLVRRY